ncbi:hypothetical protein BESB_010050 [Besnoitia besnoiti]|uniref:Uncharacterized protein n=1 Tax=Besnoitia besnoiti TaxID=94643 RepID=A0A2A9MQP8_BESBE|nr:hypothetical protein BESB_010050 [Besnoitia besnoiti]PFH38663.1 hypothetical protein BESB_010050 [Besnoitia besnoiti]
MADPVKPQLQTVGLLPTLASLLGFFSHSAFCCGTTASLILVQLRVGRLPPPRHLSGEPRAREPLRSSVKRQQTLLQRPRTTTAYRVTTLEKTNASLPAREVPSERADHGALLPERRAEPLSRTAQLLQSEADRASSGDVQTLKSAAGIVKRAARRVAQAGRRVTGPELEAPPGDEEGRGEARAAKWRTRHTRPPSPQAYPARATQLWQGLRMDVPGPRRWDSGCAASEDDPAVAVAAAPRRHPSERCSWQKNSLVL